MWKRQEKANMGDETCGNLQKVGMVNISSKSGASLFLS